VIDSTGMHAIAIETNRAFSTMKNARYITNFTTNFCISLVAIPQTLNRGIGPLQFRGRDGQYLLRHMEKNYNTVVETGAVH